MRKISILAVLIMVLVPVMVSAGDPLDTNDGPDVISVTSIEEACGLVEKWPSCVPCRTTCYYAIMSDLWVGGGWDWG